MAILSAAGALLDEGGPDAATLSAIAQRAGVVKSGVYRYFESREEILIHLLIEGGDDMVAELEAACGSARADPAAWIAGRVAEGFAARPRLCHLISIMAPTLERNISTPTIVVLKTQMHGLHRRAAAAVRRAHPGLGEGEAELAIQTAFGLVAGFWPMKQPGPRVAEALAQMDAPIFRDEFTMVLARCVHAVLSGSAAACAARPPGSGIQPWAKSQ